LLRWKNKVMRKGIKTRKEVFIIYMNLKMNGAVVLKK